MEFASLTHARVPGVGLLQVFGAPPQSGAMCQVNCHTCEVLLHECMIKK